MKLYWERDTINSIAMCDEDGHEIASIVIEGMIGAKEQHIADTICEGFNKHPDSDEL